MTPAMRRFLLLLSIVMAFVGTVGTVVGLAQEVSPGSARGDRVEFSGTTMGPIEWHVVVVGRSGKGVAAADLVKRIQAALDQVDRLMSTYKGESDISRFNRAEPHRWVAVDPLVVQVVQRSLEVSGWTDGAFDITVGPAVDLWDFGPQASQEELPADAEVEAVHERIGYEKLQVREDPPALKKTAAGVEIDLSAVAKGFAVDRVAEVLVEAGWSDFMVEVGGEVAVRGQNADGAPWRIGIERPEPGVRAIDLAVGLSDVALATSGDYRNFRVIDGVRYSHTIDPRTARPVESGIALASVVAADCMTADALATAAMVMGERDRDDSGLADLVELGEKKGFSVRLVRRREGGAIDVVARSKGFPQEWKHVESAESRQPRSEGVKESASSFWPMFVGALVVFALAVAAMAVGAIFGNRPIQGSCGGIGTQTNADGETTCSLCSKPVAECPEKTSSS